MFKEIICALRDYISQILNLVCTLIAQII